MKIRRSEVIMPGGIELSFEAEKYLELNADKEVLSIACGTGEIEIYFNEKYSCTLLGVDISEKLIERAKRKVNVYKLKNINFIIGDGNNLEIEDSTFDVVYCSGAICAFYYNGVKTMNRVLKPGGRAAIIEVVWREQAVPQEIKDVWAGDSSIVLTEEGNNEVFENNNFRVIYSKTYDEPEWWKAYFDDRGKGEHWDEERKNYHAHRKYLGLGLFILEKI
ncbi:MAG: class I SAM-dependent methyltransferase [Candidatus Heimdallarchaeota archaeon]|nr:class I SAM-dependent methyltransferase [Candidatus Heimdallarchaeota archaeon]